MFWHCHFRGLTESMQAIVVCISSIFWKSIGWLKFVIFSCRGHGQITVSPDSIHPGPQHTSGPTGSTSGSLLCFGRRTKCHGQLVASRYESLSCHPFFPPKKIPKNLWFLGCNFLGGWLGTVWHGFLGSRR